MVYGFKSLRRHAGECERTPHLLAERGEHFHFSPRMLVGLAMLYVDDAHYLAARDDGRREKGFESVLGKLTEIFEARIAVGFA